MAVEMAVPIRMSAINPNGKVPAIVDTEGTGGKEARVFDFTAILLYLAEKTGKLLGAPEDRPELLSWLLFLASGLGPFSGQAVHFQFAAPEGSQWAPTRSRFRIGLDPAVSGREVRRVPTERYRDRTETLNWPFWQMGSAPYLGGGFGHFYAYAPGQDRICDRPFRNRSKAAARRARPAPRRE
jgi:glutathione S-transferase